MSTHLRCGGRAAPVPLRRVATATAIFLAVTLAACASLAPGADPVVVRTEQALSAADAIYSAAMRWYFTPGVAPTLGRDAITVLEKVRTGYDGPYKAMQGALDTYKLLKTPDAKNALVARTADLAAVINPALGLIPGSTLKPVEVP